MICNACGQQVPPGSTFCNRCGKPLPKETLPRQPARSPEPTVAGQLGRVAGTATRIFIRAGPKAWLVAAFVVIVVLVLFNVNTQQQPTTASRSAPEAEKTTEPVATVNRPTEPPPKFRVYRSKMDEGTSVVVSPVATDEQLKSLLWLFRENVRSHHFKDIGMNSPTSLQWGKKGYLSGMITVYRGEKCAGENFPDTRGAGPCGQGDHSAAYYQWGLLVDGVFQTDADSAGVNSSDGTSTEIFSYKDHWQLPASLQAELDAERKTQQEQAKVEQQTRKAFAELLESRLTASGFDISVRAREEDAQELSLGSDIFKDTATRVEFLHQVLPTWRKDLCAAGFRQVRLIRGGMFSTGDAYSIGCK